MDLKVGEIAELLYETGCIKFGVFKLSSGKVSSIYVDLRILSSFPKEFKTIVKLSSQIINRVNFDIIAGVAVGGLPLATAIAYELNKPLIYVRKTVKDHGTGRLVEGVIRKGVKALIVDDVATTGNSLVRTINILRENGAKIDHAFVVIDREQGSREKLRKMGIELLSLATLREVIKELYTRKRIDYETYVKVLSSLG